MPIFEYRCKKCNYEFEELVLGKKEIKCPKCQNTDLKKIISGFNIAGESSISSISSSSGNCEDGSCSTCSSCNL